MRRRRVQCPKCREVVTLAADEATEGAVMAPSRAENDPATAEMLAETRNKVEFLEARVEALEAVLRDALAAVRTSMTNGGERRLFWVTAAPGGAPEYSAEQDRALLHNLSGVPVQSIALRIPAGDVIARAHAEWFRSVFDRAGWTVFGPDEILPLRPIAGLTLAVPELPVARDAAATYLALKAAGFEPQPVLDPIGSRENHGDRAAMSLTLPAGDAG